MLGRSSLLVPAFLMSSSTALGCVVSPVTPPPICQRFWEEDAVALVSVQKIEKRAQDRFVTLQASEIYRGAPPNELVMKDPVTDCGPNFGHTGLYLAWFYHSKSGKWKAYGEPVEASEEDLRYAQSMKNPPKVGHIYGTLDKQRRPPFMPILKNPDPGQNRAGTTVVAESENGLFRADVGSDLSFDFPRLPRASTEYVWMVSQAV